jgi:crotonobetainyl-CoA:carnitine CoA-transferase CaiB-like acyl-CoA transferase
MTGGPLEGVRVLDFSTLLPGPLATLYLAQAGAEIIKIERPAGGDPVRSYPPLQGGKSVLFELLNTGKSSVAVDLKNPENYSRLLELVGSADILVEQFRPGVMARLQLDFDSLKNIYPNLIYCSISGYGQRGINSQVVGHDLNYQAWMGLLALAGEHEDTRIVPALIADIAGGTHAAVINILLALRTREQTTHGCHLDIAMTDGLYPFMLSALANWSVGNSIASGGNDLLTGGSPRYQLYRTADGHYLAAAPLEEHFWQRFAELIELPGEMRLQQSDADTVCQKVRDIIAKQPASYWEARFEGEDVCCTLVRSLAEALADPAVEARSRVKLDGSPALDLLVVPTDVSTSRAPSCGQDNQRFGFPQQDG